MFGPKTDLYVGQHFGVITFYDEDEIMYQEEFQVIISSPVSSAPYFINLEPPSGYDYEELGPIKMPALKVYPNE